MRKEIFRKIKSPEEKYWGPKISPEEFEEKTIGSVSLDKISSKEGPFKGLKTSEAIIKTEQDTKNELMDEFQKPASIWNDREQAEFEVRYHINLFNTLKEFQPYDPANPDPKHSFARGIRQQFIELLLKKGEIKETEADFDRVKFYTVAKVKALDQDCGVDGILEYTNKEGKKLIVTFDVTTNKEKERGYFANIIVYDKRLHDPNEEAAETEKAQSAEDKKAETKKEHGEVYERKIYRDEFFQKLDAFVRLAHGRMKPVEESFRENFKRHEPFRKIRKMAEQIPLFMHDPAKLEILVKEMQELVNQLPPHARKQAEKIIKENSRRDR